LGLPSFTTILRFERHTTFVRQSAPHTRMWLHAVVGVHVCVTHVRRVAQCRPPQFSPRVEACQPHFNITSTIHVRHALGVPTESRGYTGVVIDASTTFLHIYTNSISFAFIYTHTPYIQYPCVRMSPHPPHTTLTGVQSNRTFRRHFGPSFMPCRSSAPLGVRPHPCVLPTYAFRWLRCACA
jgi:hypothetical protein